MLEGIRWRMKRLATFFSKASRNRVTFARWLLEKLLGSFLISTLVLYGSVVGFQLSQSSFQSVYLAVTLLSVSAYLISVFLVPRPNRKRRPTDEADMLEG